LYDVMRASLNRISNSESLISTASPFNIQQSIFLSLRIASMENHDGYPTSDASYDSGGIQENVAKSRSGVNSESLRSLSVVPGTPNADTLEFFPSSDPPQACVQPFPNARQAHRAGAALVGTPSAVGAIRVRKSSTMSQFMTPAPIRSSPLAMQDSVVSRCVTKVNRCLTITLRCTNSNFRSQLANKRSRQMLSKWNLKRKMHDWCSRLQDCAALCASSSKNWPRPRARRISLSAIYTSIEPKKQGGCSRMPSLMLGSSCRNRRLPR
jgi:hypothetical protein